jgi:hypothetical protein
VKLFTANFWKIVIINTEAFDVYEINGAPSDGIALCSPPLAPYSVPWSPRTKGKEEATFSP